MPKFSFNINEVGDEGKDFTWPIDGPWVETELAAAELRPDSASGPGRLEVHVQKNGNEFLLQGHAAVDLLAPCVRCLEDAPLALATDLVGMLRTDPGTGEPLGETEEYLNEDALVGDVVQLDDWVREHLVVECPMRHVCGDDCNGLQVPAHIRPPDDFGEDREGVDPRLAPLLELKDKVLPNKE